MAAPMYNGIYAKIVDHQRNCSTKGGRWDSEKQQCYDKNNNAIFGGRRSLIGPLKKGTLMGYSARMKPAARHKTLRKVIRKVGPLSTFRKLNAIAVLTKRTAPKSSRKMQTDRKWVKKNFM
jgi:hypothetical protein